MTINVGLINFQWKFINNLINFQWQFIRCILFAFNDSKAKIFIKKQKTSAFLHADQVTSAEEGNPVLTFKCPTEGHW